MIKLKLKDKLFLNYLLFFVLIQWMYAKVIAVVYGYSGIVIEFNLLKEAVALVVLIIVLVIACYLTEVGPISFTNDIFLIFSGIPTLAVIPISKKATWQTMLYCILFWLIFESIILFLSYKKQKERDYKKHSHQAVPTIQRSTMPNLKHIQVIMLAITIFSIYMVMVYGEGFHILLFSESVDVRLELRETPLPKLQGYIHSMLGLAIMPLVTAYGFAAHKKWVSIVSILDAYLLYTINGMKTYLLLQVSAIYLAYALKNKKNNVRNGSLTFVSLGNLLLISGIAIYFTIGDFTIPAYIARAITLPAEETIYYIDFFNTHELLFLRGSFMRHFFPSPYAEPPSRMIGHIYYGSQTMNCTNGMISDAVANFGLLGIIFYPAMYIAVIMLMAKFVQEYEISFTSTMIFSTSVVFVGNSYFTVLITGGYIASFLFLAYMKTQNTQNKARRFRKIVLERRRVPYTNTTSIIVNRR